MSFHVGQKVECVDDTERKMLRAEAGMDGLKKGNIYTIREAGLRAWADGAPAVRLMEIVRRHGDGDTPYWAHRFRPIVERKTSIAIFTRMLTPNKERVS